MRLRKRIFIILAVGSFLVLFEILGFHLLNRELDNFAHGLEPAFQSLTNAVQAATFLSNLATSTKAKGVAEVEKYCAEVQARTSKREPDFVLGLSSSTDDHKRQWQKYGSTAELKKAVESAQVIYDEQVYVWTEEGSVIAANFTLQDGSGDWTLYPDYCFHKNGTTAEISSELRTSFGMMLVLRNWTFDSSGRLLESKEKFLDLDTRSPKKPDEEFVDEKTLLYRKVADLPFLPLLGKLNRQP